MEGRLLLWVVIITVIVRTERSYGGKVNIVGGDIIGHCENRMFIWREVNIVGVGNIGIVRTESSYGGRVNIVGGDNIGHCENKMFIWREG
jgi:hypothetical protein